MIQATVGVWRDLQKTKTGYAGLCRSILANERAWFRAELEKIFRGEDWLASAKSIGVTHIYWGDSEKGKYGFLDQPWKHQLRNVSRSSKIDIYDVRTYQ